MIKCTFVLFVLLFVTGNTFSQTSNLPDTLSQKIIVISGRLAKIDSSLKILEDSAQFITAAQFESDSSSLDSARNNPRVFLYKNYALNKTIHKPLGKKEASANNHAPLWLVLLNAALALLVFAFMWWLALKNAINGALIKDESFDANGNRLDALKCSFSFARTQLFWWTMIVLSCYVIFFGLTGVLPPLNATAVGLLGLSVFVYGAGKVIDNRQINANKGFRSQDTGANESKPDFLKDILSDDNGISIHRFQALIFNLAFGLGFIAIFVADINSRKYPFADFTSMQFALMGISSATYLGLKAAENNPDNVSIGKAASATSGNADAVPASEGPAATDGTKPGN